MTPDCPNLLVFDVLRLEFAPLSFVAHGALAPKIVARAVLRSGMAHARRMLSEPKERQLRIAFKAFLRKP